MKLIGYLGQNWCVIAFHEGNHMHALLCAVLNTVVTNRTMPSSEVARASKDNSSSCYSPQKRKNRSSGIRLTLLLSTGIQGKLATQTPSKHPGHKPELSPAWL